MGAIAAVVALVAAVVGGATWWIGRDASAASTPVASPSGKTCDTLTPVTLWAAPSMQRAAHELAKAYQKLPDSPCVN